MIVARTDLDFFMCSLGKIIFFSKERVGSLRKKVCPLETPIVSYQPNLPRSPNVGDQVTTLLEMIIATVGRWFSETRRKGSSYQ